MSFSDKEIRALSAASEERGWAEIPDGIPTKFLNKIVETRAKAIGYTPGSAPASQPQPTTNIQPEPRERLAAVALF